MKLSASTDQKTIAIAGLIGAGKTTLANDIARCLSYDIAHENVDKTWLEIFYKDIPKNGFTFQIILLSERMKQIGDMISNGTTSGVVFDRSIIEDFMFVHMLHEDKLLDDFQVETYTRMFDSIADWIIFPDVIVHLDVDPIVAYNRVQIRNRTCEMTTVNVDYLKKLKTVYDTHLNKIASKYDITLITIDWNEFKSTNEVLEQISNVIPTEVVFK